MMRFLTSGESHGKGLISVIEGFPSNVPIDEEFINAELKRRMGGYGRGRRMQIESDAIEIFAGVRHGRTLGSPIAFLVQNRDWVNWQDIMSCRPDQKGAAKRVVTRARPGHADLVGALKYGFSDMRDVLERSSARETASRVAVGAFSKILLQRLGIRIYSHVVSIKDVHVSDEQLRSVSIDKVPEIEASELRTCDKSLDEAMKRAVDRAIEKGETIGGTFEVRAVGAPVGIGSYVHWDRKLDGRLAQAIMSINAIKAVEVGTGLGSDPYGSEYHDEIFYDADRGEFYRETNHAGGIEGGTTTGGEVIVRGVVKPIPTLRRPLRSVDLTTKEPFEAQYERSDTCVVPAAAVVGEAMVAIVVLRSMQEKFGGDSLSEMEANVKNYRSAVRAR